MVEPSGQGKLSQYAYNLSRALIASGNTVCLVTGQADRLKEKPDVPMVPLFPKGLIGPRTYWRFFKLIRSENPDIVHIQWVPSAPFMVAVGVMRRWVRAKIICTAHNVMPHEAKFYHSYFFSRFYSRLDRVLVHSQVDREEMRALTGLADRGIGVVPVPSPIGWKQVSTKAQARAELGLAADDQLILFFGYVSREKGIEESLSAIELVRRQVAKAKLLVVGEAGDDSVREKIKCTPGVIAELDYVSNDRAATYFSACDMVVLPYRKANQSPIIPMAYSFGRPVVASNHQIETVVPGETGYLVKPGDPQDLAEGIIAVLGESSSLRALSEGAAVLGAATYSNEGVAKANTAVYKGLLNYESGEALTI